MDCDNIRPQLELFVLGGLPPVEADLVRKHLAGCEDCRRIERECRLLVAEVRGRAVRTPPRPAFVRRVHQVVAREVRATRRRTVLRRAALATGAVAAGVVLAMAVWGAWPGARDASSPDAPVVGERWRYDGALAQPASSADSVVVHDGSMYFLRRGADGGRVVAIDLATGRDRWRSRVRSVGYLAADAARVYCLAPAGPRRITLRALDASRGTVRWSRSHRRDGLLTAPCPPVAVRPGRLAWTSGTAVHLLDASTGRPIWQRTFPGEGAASAAAVAGETLLVASGTALYCLEAASGREMYRITLGDDKHSGWRPLLALAGPRAYLVLRPRAARAVLYCLDLSTRRTLWREPAGQVRHLLATSRGVFLRAQGIVARDARTGRVLWKHEMAGCGPMTADAGRLYLTDSAQAGRLVVLDQQDGQEVWHLAGIRSCDAFRRVGPTGYVKAHDGAIHAIALRTK